MVLTLMRKSVLLVLYEMKRVVLVVLGVVVLSSRCRVVRMRPFLKLRVGNWWERVRERRRKRRRWDNGNILGWLVKR